MKLREYHSSEVAKFADAVALTIGSKRVELASVLSDVLPETLELAEELEAISKNWNPVELYTADNFETERSSFLEAFKRGKEYVPEFEYARAASFDAAGARMKLEVLRTRALALPKESERDRLARITLVAKIDDDLATCDIAEGMATKNDALVKRGCAAKYPKGDTALTLFATHTFADVLSDPAIDVPSQLSGDEKEYLQNRKLTPQEQADGFRWALQQYDMYRQDGDETGDGFQVILDPAATAIDVRDKSRLGSAVFIPTTRDGDMTADEFCALVAHEIEGHARQAVNGKRLFKVGGGALRKDDETLYEGLAIRYEWEFMETHFGKVRHDMDLSTLYVFAVDIAEKGGTFTDIFKDQLERRIRLALKIPIDQPVPDVSAIDPKTYESCLTKAWRTTYRVMRGHTDTSNKEGFAMTKDLAYLRGWLMDQQLLDSNLGHANEVAIMSATGLQSLATMAIDPEHVPIKFKNIAPTYMRMLLDQRPKTDA